MLHIHMLYRLETNLVVKCYLTIWPLVPGSPFIPLGPETPCKQHAKFRSVRPVNIF